MQKVVVHFAVDAILDFFWQYVYKYYQQLNLQLHQPKCVNLVLVATLVRTVKTNVVNVNKGTFQRVS